MRKLGLSDFGARTVQFIVVRPLKIALILAAYGVSRGPRVRRALGFLPHRGIVRAWGMRHERRGAHASLLMPHAGFHFMYEATSPGKSSLRFSIPSPSL